MTQTLLPGTILGQIGDLALTSGKTLPNARLAYVTYGRLAPNGKNAVLLTHGYTTKNPRRAPRFVPTTK